MGDGNDDEGIPDTKVAYHKREHDGLDAESDEALHCHDNTDVLSAYSETAGERALLEAVIEYARTLRWHTAVLEEKQKEVVISNAVVCKDTQRHCKQDNPPVENLVTSAIDALGQLVSLALTFQSSSASCSSTELKAP